MGRVITFANRKGGSGKTTVVVNLAAALGRLGKRVLVVDLDPQCHATLISSINTYERKPGISAALSGQVPLHEVILPTQHGLFDVVPSFHHEPEISLAGRIEELKDLFKPLLGYEFILIDTPPSRQDTLAFALSVSFELMIPLPLQFLAMEGLAQLIGLLHRCILTYQAKVKLTGIIPVMYDLRTNHAKGVLKELKEAFGEEVIKRPIRIDVQLAEAAWNQKPIFIYRPKSKAAYDFHMLANDIIVE